MSCCTSHSAQCARRLPWCSVMEVGSAEGVRPPGRTVSRAIWRNCTLAVKGGPKLDQSGGVGRGAVGPAMGPPVGARRVDGRRNRVPCPRDARGHADGGHRRADRGRVGGGYTRNETWQRASLAARAPAPTHTPAAVVARRRSENTRTRSRSHSFAARRRSINCLRDAGVAHPHVS